MEMKGNMKLKETAQKIKELERERDKYYEVYMRRGSMRSEGYCKH